MIQIYGLVNYLTGGSSLSFVNEVAAAKLFGGQAHRLRNFVQVPLQRKDTLRSAKSAKRAVWRNVGSDGLTADANIWTVVGSGGVNRSSRKDDG